MKEYVTIRDVAKEVGLHFTTVAEALRDSARISVQTRQIVKAKALAMGYKKDHRLGALASYRSRLRENHSFQGVIAWLNCYPTMEEYLDKCQVYRDYLTGVEQECARLGFLTERHFYRPEKVSGLRLLHILKSRNIQGLIFPPVPLTSERLDFDCSSFHSVRLGHTLLSPRLDRVSPHGFRNLNLAFDKILEFGHERIGFICPDMVNAALRGQFLGAFLSKSLTSCLKKNAIPPLLCPDSTRSETAQSISKWVQKYQPTAIIVPNVETCRLIQNTGLSIPGDVSVVLLSKEFEDSAHAGIYEEGKAVGAAAVQVIVGKLNTSLQPSNQPVRSLLITGQWQAGKSLKHCDLAN